MYIYIYIEGALILLLSASLYQSQDYLGVCSMAASALSPSHSFSLFALLFVTVAAWYLWDLWQGPPRLNVCLLIFIQIYFFFSPPATWREILVRNKN